jgi:transposase
MPEPLHATSIRALAKRLGVSPTTVQRDLAAEYGDLEPTREGELIVPYWVGLDGKARPARKFDTSGRDALIIRLRTEGKSLRAIATAAKCSVGTVHRVTKSIETKNHENQNDAHRGTC